MTYQFVKVDQLLAEVVDVRRADAQLRQQRDDRRRHHGYGVHAPTFRPKAPGQDYVGGAREAERQDARRQRQGGGADQASTRRAVRHIMQWRYRV